MEKVNLTIRLDKEMKLSIDEFCRKRDVTISQLVRGAFRRYLNDAREAEKQEKATAAREGQGKTQEHIAAIAAFTRSPGSSKSRKNRR